MGSEWTSFIPIHADAIYIKHSFEQLSTISEVDVIQNDAVDQAVIITDKDLVHHHEIHFKSNTGNLDALVNDLAHILSSNHDANILIYNGNNALDSQSTKSSAANPGEVPVDYGLTGS